MSDQPIKNLSESDVEEIKGAGLGTAFHNMRSAAKGVSEAFWEAGHGRVKCAYAATVHGSKAAIKGLRKGAQRVSVEEMRAGYARAIKEAGL